MNNVFESPAYLVEGGLLPWRAATIGADGFPEQLFHFDSISESPVDAIFCARVTKLDSASDLAFLDLGSSVTGVMNLRRAGLRIKGRPTSIHDCLTEGETLLVQAVNDPAPDSGKSVMVTPKPRLAGKYAVVEFGPSRLNFSKDIKPHTIGALKASLSALAETCAIIVRSAAVDAPTDCVIAEAALLSHALNAELAKPSLVFALCETQRALIAAPEGDTPIITESGACYDMLRATAAEIYPHIARRITAHKGNSSLFEIAGVNEAIDEALADTIMLPSGGWITIEATTAMTIVDVNLGGALAGRQAQDAIIQVNLEAALAIAHHLRFQDIGGLIVIDFINMNAKGAISELMHVLDDALQNDPVPVQHSGMSNFGLVELSRKRRGISLRQRLMTRPVSRKNARHVGEELLRKALVLGTSNTPGIIKINAPENVINWIEMSGRLSAIGTRTARKVTLTQSPKTDIMIVQEKKS